MATSTPSIEKLQKKLEKEPNSLIFLQLAEEYRKEADYEEALRACKEGLRRHPNYWSARVALGRIYHEMGDTERAREELEKVTKAVPDNLLANKLLGDIYMESGRMPDALKRYQIVQMLTPNDQEVVSNLQKIESHIMSSGRPETQASPVVPPPLPVAEPPAPPPPPSPPVEVATVEEPAPALPLEIPAFLEKTEPGARASASAMNLMDSTMPQQDSRNPSVPPPPPASTPLESHSAHAETDLAALFMESAHSNEITVTPAFGSTEEEHFPPPFTPLQMEGTVTSENPSPQAAPRAEDRTQPMQEKEELGEFEGDELTTQTLAELYVQQGLIDKAVKVFQKLLLNDPGNQLIIQRLRELSPADAFMSMAAANDREAASESFGHRGRDSASPIPGRPSEQQSNDRRRKITTLENWLAAIRRERE